VLVLALQQEGAGTAQAPKTIQAGSSIEEVSSGNVSMIEDDDVVEDDEMAEHDLQATEQQQDGQPEAARTVFTGELVSCAAGEYHFTYMVAQAGSYRLSVLVGRDKELVGHMPLIIQALPGALSSQHCGLVGKRVGTGTLLYGSSATLSLYLRDAFGNYISCAHYGVYPPLPSPACSLLCKLPACLVIAHVLVIPYLRMRHTTTCPCHTMSSSSCVACLDMCDICVACVDMCDICVACVDMCDISK